MKEKLTHVQRETVLEHSTTKLLGCGLKFWAADGNRVLKARGRAQGEFWQAFIIPNLEIDAYIELYNKVPYVAVAILDADTVEDIATKVEKAVKQFILNVSRQQLNLFDIKDGKFYDNPRNTMPDMQR